MPEYDSTISYRPIPKHPGYCAGSDGTIWSCWKIVGIKGIGLGRRGAKSVMTDQWHSLALTKNKLGYQTVNLQPSRPVHQLVLEAFAGPRPKGKICRHFPDRDPSNNRIENLQWGTYKQNCADKIVHGTGNKGEKHGNAKLTEEIVKQIRQANRKGVMQKTLAEQHHVSPMAISRIVRRLYWSHVR